MAFKVDPLALTSEQYGCLVFWMEGRLGTSQVAKAIGWTPGQVRGYVHRALTVPRNLMTIEDRQQALNGLTLCRGLFTKYAQPGRDHLFVAKVIDTLPVKERPTAAELPPLDLNTRAGRREARRRKMAEYEKEQQEKRLAEQVANSGMAQRKAIPDVVEWLRLNGWLSDPHERSSDPGRNKEAPTGARRHRAAELLKKYSDGSRLSSLGAIDYESATMGGGSGVKLSLPEYKLWCIATIGSISKWMNPGTLALIESVVCEDAVPWKDGPQRLIEPIRHGLDIVAVHESLMTRQEFRERWDYSLPIEEPPSRGDARQQAGAMFDLMGRSL